MSLLPFGLLILGALLLQLPATVTVDTTSTVIDGDTSSVGALLGNRGADGLISLREALAAVNNDPVDGHTIDFSLTLDGSTIVLTFSENLNASNTTIDGDVDGDETPDVGVIHLQDAIITLRVWSDNNVIRNLVIERLDLFGAGAHSNLVSGNYIGTDVSGLQATPIEGNGLIIREGAHNNIVEDNIIAGNSGGTATSGWSGVILVNAHDNELRYNWIGLNVNGDPLPNDFGVSVGNGAQGNTIGGSRPSTACAAPCNVISGNSDDGVAISGSGTTNNVVEGNFIGLDPTGAMALPNGDKGVAIFGGAAENRIGGELATASCGGACNVISGNLGNGVEIEGNGTTGNKVQGNYIGLNPMGQSPVPNVLAAIFVNLGASQNLIGGPRAGSACDGPCNVISGNNADGILLSDTGTAGNVIQGNFVGVNATGSAAVPNQNSGIRLDQGATNNLVGGERDGVACNGPCNVISGNQLDGVTLVHATTSSNEIQGNYIGVDPANTMVLGNALHGVSLFAGAPDNLIGNPAPQPGECTGACNLIRGNAFDGVSLYDDAAQGITIRGNAIYGNGQMNIDLNNDEVTPNDEGDADSGPNSLINFPTGVSAVYNRNSNQTTITGQIHTENPGQTTIDVYAGADTDAAGAGEMQWYLGSTTPDDNGAFALPPIDGPLPDEYWFLSASATDANGSTSETGLRPPLIFVPGVAGSQLQDGIGGEIMWLDGILDLGFLHRLSLYPDQIYSQNIYAPDVIYKDPLNTPVYSTLLDVLTIALGYRRYDLQFSGDQTPPEPECEEAKAAENPTLFVFPYDWRKDNVQSAAKLKEYIDCVRELYPGAQVDILTHSMGSLVARRYILDNPNDHHLNKLVTVAAPWLGAAKLVNVLQTGDFLDKGYIPIVNDGFKTVARSSTAAHQLGPGRLYAQIIGRAPLVEGFWDFDGDGTRGEQYSFNEYVAVLDNVFGREVNGMSFLPGAAADSFHQEAQDDWSSEGPGIHYYHLFGSKLGNSSIERVEATYVLRCAATTPICVIQPIFKKHMTMGDGTVPLFSARRLGYNAGHACLIGFFSQSDDEDPLVEHNGLNNNPQVHETLFSLLNRGFAPTLPGQPEQPCSPPFNSPAVAQGSLDPEPYTYLTIYGAETPVISDAFGNNTAPIEDLFRAEVPGVTHYAIAENSELIILPATGVYTATFQTIDQPLAVELTKGTGDTAFRAIRYLDLSLPPDVTAMLTITDQGADNLRYDGNGDGTFETVVAPTVDVTGAAANDLDPPAIGLAVSHQESGLHVTLTAQDTGSGVSAIYYSLDGATFQPYTQPFHVDGATIPVIHAFADDHVGNRGILVQPLGFDAVFLPAVFR